MDLACRAARLRLRLPRLPRWPFALSQSRSISFLLPLLVGAFPWHAAQSGAQNLMLFGPLARQASPEVQYMANHG